MTEPACQTKLADRVINMPADAAKPTCFIAMPITTHADEAARYGEDAEHWNHVMETIFVPAIERAGFAALRPAAVGSHMIHGQIIRHLSKANMVLCDLSGHNPNVFFELGVRTSLNLPIALVRDEHTTLPFDTSGLNTHEYASTLHGWEVEQEIARLTQHLKDSAESCDGSNPMWRHFGLTIAAETPSAGESSSDARLEIMFESIGEIRHDLSEMKRKVQSSTTDLTASASSKLVRATMRRLWSLGSELGSALGAELSGVSNESDDVFRLRYSLTDQNLSVDAVTTPASRIFKPNGFEAHKFEFDDKTLQVWVRPF